MARKPSARNAPPLRAQAYESFTHHLLARNVRPGQFVSQRELVELTGMPLGAIRELVPRLEAEGLITTVPQRGMQIAHVDLRFVKNAFQLRAVLKTAAARHFVQVATDEDVASLIADHQAVIDAAADGPADPALVDRAQAVDWRLHDRFIEACDNDLLTDVYRVNSIRIRLIRQERVRLEPTLVAPVMRDHMAILEALARRDEAGVVGALGIHLSRARDRALKL